MKREGASTLSIHGFPWALSYLLTETPFQHVKEVSQEIAATKAVSSTSVITRPPPRMLSLKDSRQLWKKADPLSGGNYQTFLSNHTSLAWDLPRLLRRSCATPVPEGHL